MKVFETNLAFVDLVLVKYSEWTIWFQHLNFS
jgi:hypothetical protein